MSKAIISILTSMPGVEFSLTVNSCGNFVAMLNRQTNDRGVYSSYPIETAAGATAPAAIKNLVTRIRVRAL